MNKQELINNLDLPEARAERVIGLVEKRDEEGLTTSEFIELSSNLFVRREYMANDAVSVPGVKTFFGLKHLGQEGPSINQLLRAEFGEDFSSDEITEIYERAQEEAPVYLTSNIVLFHANDVDTSDGFEVDPETAEDTAEEETDDGNEPVDVDAAIS